MASPARSSTASCLDPGRGRQNLAGNGVTETGGAGADSRAGSLLTSSLRRESGPGEPFMVMGSLVLEDMDQA